MAYDFSGWATKNDILCTDGRTIRHNAFKDNDGDVVPLVWQHLHDSPENVLGHALLENREDGTYAYCSFNGTEAAERAKELVQHGDITSMSIYANQLKQRGGDVIHGVIREVSLVLAGANKGAKIEFPVLAHSGEELEDEAIIYPYLELSHADGSDDGDKTVGDVINGLTEEQKKAVFYLLEQAMSVKHSDTDSLVDKDAASIVNSLTDDQVVGLVELFQQSNGGELSHSALENHEEEPIMKRNVFDNAGSSLQHSISDADMQEVFADAKRIGSLRDSVIAHMEDGVLAHAVTDDEGNTVNYGIADIDYLFPDARTIQNTPDFIKREDEWVKTVMNATHHTPFSRVKSVYANITMDEARAKGYIKGKLKKEEVFSLLKRTTDPQTIYKKQKLDRDDILDIVDFDVVAWIKKEMRMMLDEEIARAILIGDGRLASDDDHISTDHIRPVAFDADLYTIKADVTAGADTAATAKNMIRTSITSRKDYKGSGSPTLYTTEEWLTEMLLLEDTIGHRLYKTQEELATAMRVKNIVTVPVMEGLKDDSGKVIYGVIVNLADYNIGADKGAEVAMFDDFDIDYNQQKYLIETRISGALVKPYSAIVLRAAATSSD